MPPIVSAPKLPASSFRIFLEFLKKYILAGIEVKPLKIDSMPTGIVFAGEQKVVIALKKPLVFTEFVN